MEKDYIIDGYAHQDCSFAVERRITLFTISNSSAGNERSGFRLRRHRASEPISDAMPQQSAAPTTMPAMS